MAAEREPWRDAVDAAIAGCARVAATAVHAHVGAAIAGGAVPAHAGDLALALHKLRPGARIIIADASPGMVAVAKARAVVLSVRRGIHTAFVELEPDWNGNAGGGR